MRPAEATVSFSRVRAARSELSPYLKSAYAIGKRSVYRSCWAVDLTDILGRARSRPSWPARTVAERTRKRMSGPLAKFSANCAGPRCGWPSVRIASCRWTLTQYDVGDFAKPLVRPWAIWDYIDNISKCGTASTAMDPRHAWRAVNQHRARRDERLMEPAGGGVELHGGVRQAKRGNLRARARCGSIPGLLQIFAGARRRPPQGPQGHQGNKHCNPRNVIWQRINNSLQVLNVDELLLDYGDSAGRRLCESCRLPNGRRGFATACA